jgi:hypothetical protein
MAGSNQRFESAFPKIMKRIALLLVVPLAVEAQTTINGGRVIKGTLDASGATSTLPYRTGSGSPAGRDSCGKPGETYFQTDAPAGQNVWGCTASGVPGTWNPLSAGATVATGTTVPSGSCSAGALYLRTDVRQFYICSAANVWQLGSYGSDVLANRPLSCAAGQVFLATDLGTLSFCATPGNPGTWQVVGGAIGSVFGRTGAVTAQAGDYTAAQVTNAAQTNAGNTFTAGTQNFSGAAHTLPAVTGVTASRPATCVVGEVYFATDAPAGRNWNFCTATNTWTATGEAVPSVFGRTGPVTAQVGDYTAAQVTNAAAVNTANTWTGGFLQNFSADDVLLPMHASDPATCTAGQIEFNSTSANEKLCTSTNNWTVLSAGTGITQLTSDVTAGPGSGAVAATVAKINGTTVPTNSAPDQTLVTTASSTAAWASLANCVAAGGVLQYATATHSYSCHTLSAADLPAALPSTTSVNGTTIPASTTLMTTSTALAAAQEPAHTGDLTNPAGSLALTLTTVNSSPGSCGDATHVCQVTTNGKGLVTGQSTVAITPSGSVTETNVPPVFGGTTNITLGNSTVFNLGTLTGNTTIAVSGPTGGVGDFFIACMDATGGRLVTWPASFKNVPIFDPAPNACSLIGPIVYDGFSSYYKQGTTTSGLIAMGSTASACTGSVASGQLCVWMDTTRGTVAAKDSSGNIYVMAKTAGAASQLASSDLSDSTLLARLGNNETFTGNQSFTGNLDASSGAHTLPARVGTAASKPATCTVGEMYFATDATAGQNWYYCTATNTWTQQSGGGGGATAIASGQTPMPTTALSGNTCSASATTATATGSLTSDATEVTYASDPTGVTGYGAGTNGGITIRAWLTSNTINFKLCNETGSSITPGALSINWRVVR